ncbi:ABC transporter substrate-binding protein [Pseudonocardia sp. ICBG1142]|uniref:ABC transporter substrate-binding protein n=1 Tax=Pseudonocardia sp. ICBG1142 TaxID=2846760 RepID=UPI001CF6CCD6|nr:ABC transporter substrate-binding protein [Pseudonocardia sp. ICBG1142]
MRRTRLLTAVAATVTAAFALTACGGGSDPLAGGGQSGSGDQNTVVVGAANFTESQILSSVFAQALQAKGVTVETRPPIGSREAYVPALKDGSIDLIPDYSGTLLQYLDKSAAQTQPDEVYTALQSTLNTAAPTLTVLNRAEAENKDAVVVTRETAQRLNATSIADIAPRCGELVFGGPPEFQTRPDGIPGLQKTYNCSFKSYRSLDAGGTLTVTALKNGDVQAADLFTTDPAITANDFVVLDDPKSNFAAQNVVPLINKAKVTPQVADALNAVTAKLTTQELIGMGTAAGASNKPSVESVAREWLKRQGLV